MYGYDVSFGKNSYMGMHSKIRAKKGAKIQVGENVSFGNNTLLSCNIGGLLVIGDNCNSRDNIYLEVCTNAKMIFSERVFMNRNSIFVSANMVSIGYNVSFGPNVCIYDHNHVVKRDADNDWDITTTGTVNIGANAWIGANVCLLKNSNIGHNTVVSAGAVISNNNIEANKIVIQKRQNYIKEL